MKALAQQKSIGKLNIKTVIGYGVGGFGENTAYGIYYMFFIFFLTSIAGISPSKAGIISLFAVMWDAITDPIVGFMSDKLKTNKWGKRVPFILGGAIPMGICIFLMFCDIQSFGETAKIIYFLIINIAFWFFFTMTDLPYIVAAAEITNDYDMKTKLRTSTMVFMGMSQILLSSGVIKFIDIMAAQGQDNILTWRIIGVSLGTLSALAFVIAGFSIKGKEIEWKDEEIKNAEDSSRKSLLEAWDSFKHAFSLKQYRLVVYMAFLYNIAFGILISSQLYYCMYACSFSAGQIAVINFWPSVINLFLVVPFGGVIIKLGKKRGMLLGAFLAVLSTIIAWFLTPSMPIMMAIVLMLNISTIIFWIVIYAMNFDTSQIYLYKFDKRNEGFLLSIVSFLIKAGTAVGLWLNGTVMEFMGVDPTAEMVTDGMVHGMRVIYAGIPMVVMTMVIIFCILYKVNKDNILDLQHAIECKKAGQAYNEKSFQHIL